VYHLLRAGTDLILLMMDQLTYDKAKARTEIRRSYVFFCIIIIIVSVSCVYSVLWLDANGPNAFGIESKSTAVSLLVGVVLIILMLTRRRIQHKINSRFLRKFEDFKLNFAKGFNDIAVLKKHVREKKYENYIRIYDHTVEGFELLQKQANKFFVNPEQPLTPMDKEIDRIKSHIEEDLQFVLFCYPKIETLFKTFEDLIIKNNAHDAYYVSENIKNEIYRISQNNDFDFSALSERLMKKYQNYRERILSNPENGMLWHTIKKDEDIKRLKQEEITALQDANRLMQKKLELEKEKIRIEEQKANALRDSKR